MDAADRGVARSWRRRGARADGLGRLGRLADPVAGTSSSARMSAPRWQRSAPPSATAAWCTAFGAPRGRWWNRSWPTGCGTSPAMLGTRVTLAPSCSFRALCPARVGRLRRGGHQGLDLPVRGCRGADDRL